jgi:hypothetical protein
MVYKRFMLLTSDRAFYFYTDTGQSTGKSALDLRQFSEALRTVDARSIEFHLYREDFEKWLNFIGENALALRVAKLRKDGLRGEPCRRIMCLMLDKEIRS